MKLNTELFLAAAMDCHWVRAGERRRGSDVLKDGV